MNEPRVHVCEQAIAEYRHQWEKRLEVCLRSAARPYDLQVCAVPVGTAGIRYTAIIVEDPG